MRNSTVIGRAAAIAAVVLAIVVVGIIVLQNGSTYTVKAIFQNASQIVSGDLVQVAGNQVGTVSNISLTSNGQAQLTLSIDNASYHPLHQGTIATVRQASLSGIANRYIDLKLPSAGTPVIRNGGVIPTENTTSEVDLDQLFNTLDAPTRRGLQDFLQGSASQYEGKGEMMQHAWQYLNPAVVSTSVLFHEINRDTGKFTRFIVKSGNLVSDIAQRRSDLTALIQHLATTTSALAAQRGNLAASIQRLPGFMRLANTTFVNLRAALNDVAPLVAVSKPVAPKLQKLLEQLKPLAENSVPTVRDLANIVRRPGANNDLIELTALGVPLANATVRNINVNGKSRPGAFPQSAQSLNQSTPELGTARPYAVDLTGWFEGYTHPGTIDANGGTSRIAPVFGLTGVENGLTESILSGLPGLQQLFGQLFGAATGNQSSLLTYGQGDRCPGSMERGGIWYPESGFPCNPSQVPTGK